MSSQVFKPGDFVSVKHDVTKDYRDCDIRGVFLIPAGSIGTVISPDNTAFGEIPMIAVNFTEIENYPELFFHSKSIGPGHYIDQNNLELVCASGRTTDEFEPATDREIFRKPLLISMETPLKQCWHLL